MPRKYSEVLQDLLDEQYRDVLRYWFLTGRALAFQWPMETDTGIAPDTIEFRAPDGRVVGKIVNIGDDETD